MKTDVYRNFIAVAECGKMGEAAAKVCITQPALSQQIKSLETMYDARLFHRNPKGLVLTMAGKILYNRAKILCEIEDEARYEVSRASEECSAVNIGISSGVVSSYWMHKLAQLHASNSNVRFNVHEDQSDGILNLLQESVIDIGIVDKHPPASFRIVNVTNGKPLLVSSLGSPWIEHDGHALAIADLQGVPLCTTKGCLDRLVEACRNEGFLPNVLFTSTSWHVVVEWALEGKAVALTQRQGSADLDLHNARCTPLDCPSLESQTLVVTRKDAAASPFAQQIVGRLCQIP